MSTSAPDHGRAGVAIPEAFRLLMMQIHTAMPGTIVSYDSSTRRCRVRPSLSRLLEDGQTLERPVILDVPVIWTVTSTFALEADLAAGDEVFLVFSQRGLSRWKLVHGQSPPDVDGFFSEKDAFAIPGLGPVGAHIPPVRIRASGTGLAIDAGASGVTITTTGPVTINGKTLADAGAGTSANSGAQHTHDLTAI